MLCCALFVVLAQNLDTMLIKTPDLIEAMIELACSRRWLQCTIFVIDFSQKIVQGLWLTDNSLLQVSSDRKCVTTKCFGHMTWGSAVEWGAVGVIGMLRFLPGTSCRFDATSVDVCEKGEGSGYMMSVSVLNRAPFFLCLSHDPFRSIDRSRSCRTSGKKRRRSSRLPSLLARESHSTSSCRERSAM